MTDFVSVSIIIALVAGWLLDLLFGDPAWLPHPVVAFGKWIAFWEKRLNKGTHRMMKGAILAIFSIAMVYVLTFLFFALPQFFTSESNSYFSLFTPSFFILQSILVFFCLAGHTLRSEVRQVFLALERGLDEGRKQVARIVGRDTTQLSAQEVRTAALETLAENLSDGVVAPLFWFALLGVPGMLSYKMVNTLDSMIGYRSERYKDFGCWAAHIDDVANYIPARITAFFIIIASYITPAFHSSHGSNRGCGFIFRYGSAHASPNSGWPEAALASVLNCQFGGTHTYFGQEVEKPYIGDNPHELTTKDMRRSINVCFVAEVMAVVCVVLSVILLQACR